MGEADDPVDGAAVQLGAEKEYAPNRWRDGLVVNLFNMGDKTDPGNYRAITISPCPAETKREVALSSPSIQHDDRSVVTFAVRHPPILCVADSAFLLLLLTARRALVTACCGMDLRITRVPKSGSWRTACSDCS